MYSERDKFAFAHFQQFRNKSSNLPQLTASIRESRFSRFCLPRYVVNSVCITSPPPLPLWARTKGY